MIGCELSSFFSAVGVETTIIVRGERLLPKVDKDIEEVFREQFSSKVRTVFNATTDDLKYDGNSFTARVLSAANSIDIQADKVLFATGRIPNTENLNLDETGIRTDHRGFIRVNEELETDVPGIYAAGDVNGRNMLQHAASFQVHYLREKLLKGESGPISAKHIGYAIYSYPEVDSVGLTERMLQDQDIPYFMVMRDWLASARAMAMRIKYPKIKLLVSPEDFRILGCHMVGPESDTMIHQVLAVMELKNDVRELAEMVYIHPALNECILAAAVEAVGKVRAYQGSS